MHFSPHCSFGAIPNKAELAQRLDTGSREVNARRTFVSAGISQELRETADWLVRSLRPIEPGLWLWAFSEPAVPPSGKPTAQARPIIQASALDILVEAYSDTGEEKYRQAIERGLSPFSRAVQDLGFCLDVCGECLWFSPLLLAGSAGNIPTYAPYLLSDHVAAITFLLKLSRSSSDFAYLSQLAQRGLKGLTQRIDEYTYHDGSDRTWSLQTNPNTLVDLGFSLSRKRILTGESVARLYAISLLGDDFRINIDVGGPQDTNPSQPGHLMAVTRPTPWSERQEEGGMTFRNLTINRETRHSQLFTFALHSSLSHRIRKLKLRWDVGVSTRPGSNVLATSLEVRLLTPASDGLILDRRDPAGSTADGGPIVSCFDISPKHLVRGAVNRDVRQLDMFRVGHFRRLGLLNQLAELLNETGAQGGHRATLEKAMRSWLGSEYLDQRFAGSKDTSATGSRRAARPLAAADSLNFNGSYGVPPYLKEAEHFPLFRQDLVSAAPPWVNGYIFLRHRLGGAHFNGSYLGRLCSWLQETSGEGNETPVLLWDIVAGKVPAPFEKPVKEMLKEEIGRRFEEERPWLKNLLPGLVSEDELMVAHITCLVHGHYDFETSLPRDLLARLKIRRNEEADCRKFAYTISALASLFGIKGRCMVMHIEHEELHVQRYAAMHVVYVTNNVIFDGQTNLMVRLATDEQGELDFPRDVTTLISSGRFIPCYNRFLDPEQRELCLLVLDQDPGVISFFYYWYFLALSKSARSRSHIEWLDPPATA